MPSLNMPTGATPGTASSVLSASGISDSAFVNIGGEIRRESQGRTIAGGMRLGRFYGLKPHGEIQGLIDAERKAQLNAYVADLKTQGYTQKNNSTLEKDIGGGYKEVITIDWNTGNTVSNQALTEAAARAMREQEQAAKRAEKSYENRLLIQSYSTPNIEKYGEAVGTKLGMSEFFAGKAMSSKSPSEKASLLDASARAKGQAFNVAGLSTAASKTAAGSKILNYLVAGPGDEKASRAAIGSIEAFKKANPKMSNADVINFMTGGAMTVQKVAPPAPSRSSSGPSRAKSSNVSAVKAYTSQPITKASTDAAIKAIEKEKARGGSNADVINRIISSWGKNRRVIPDTKSKNREYESDPVKRFLSSELPSFRKRW